MYVCEEIVKSLIMEMDSDIISEEGLDIQKFEECLKLQGLADVQCVGYTSGNDWLAVFRLGAFNMVVSWRIGKNIDVKVY